MARTATPTPAELQAALATVNGRVAEINATLKERFDPPDILAERDQLQQEAARIRAELARPAHEAAIKELSTAQEQARKMLAGLDRAVADLLSSVRACCDADAAVADATAKVIKIEANTSLSCYRAVTDPRRDRADEIVMGYLFNSLCRVAPSMADRLQRGRR